MYPEIPIHLDSRFILSLSRNFFPDCISGSANDINSMAFALKEEKVISSCGRGHYVMQKVVF